MPSCSPLGARLQLDFPIGENEKLRKQYQMLDMNGLRMGKMLELIDMLSYDSCHNYVEGNKDIYFTTIALSGIQFSRRLVAD